MPEFDEYRDLARGDRLRVQQETLPMVRAKFAASAERWEYLAKVTAPDPAAAGPFLRAD